MRHQEIGRAKLEQGAETHDRNQQLADDYAIERTDDPDAYAA